MSLSVQNITLQIEHAFSAESLIQAEADFCAKYPQYTTTRCLDELRHTDYARLDDTHQTYLDYTGGGVYAESQLKQHMEMLQNNVYGNPHSFNLTSMAMTKLVEQTRAAILRFFRADPDEYEAIFTANATGALKLVAESYPFASDSHFLICYDNHNSVNGIREFARAKGAEVTYVPVVGDDLRCCPQELKAGLRLGENAGNKLFAFPAQSNFSGVQHPLTLIEEAHQKGWDVLVDGAAFAPTNRLDLSVWKPDFVPISFYKMFGYPTGVGCLLAKRDKLAKLCRPWYAGGTVSFASVQADTHYLTPGAAGFEDGTLNYLSIPAVEIGLCHLDSIGMELIHERVMCLTAWLLDQLTRLQHTNGNPMVQIYGPTTTECRGGTVQFNLLDRDGMLIDGFALEQLANKTDMSLRTGCHCNPGTSEVALGYDAKYIVSDGHVAHLSLGQVLERLDEKMAGAVRVSLGIVSNFSDVFHFVAFVEGFRDKLVGDVGRIRRVSMDHGIMREGV
jgi:selenocysteine lyase/cysteine desulfurase